MSHNCGNCLLVANYMIYQSFAIGCDPGKCFDILGHIVILELVQVFVREGIFISNIYVEVTCYDCWLIIYSV